MAKKIGIIVTALLCILILAGCGCEHVWLDATCQAPATCELCGKTEGELGEHIWQDATCTAPKTCATCGAAEGEKLDHKWLDATCEKPQVCELCGAEQGVKRKHEMEEQPCSKVCKLCGFEIIPRGWGHVWDDATCEVPKTCLVCDRTEGETLPHNWRDATCKDPKTCKDCGATEGELGEHSWVDATCIEEKHCSVCNAIEGGLADHLYVEAECSKYCSVCNGTEGPYNHVLTEESDGVTGVCTACDKAIENFFEDGVLNAWTEYEIASDGTYINPITYIQGFPQPFERFRWFENGTLRDYKFVGHRCRAFYVDGKVYYFKSYEPKNPETVVRTLMNAATKYLSFTEGIYNNQACTNVILNGPGGLGRDTRGEVSGVVDVYGKTFAIVHKDEGVSKPDDPTLTWVVACNWKK